MNDSNKTFMRAFYNSFLKIKLNCDKENSFPKKILSKLTCVLIY